MVTSSEAEQTLKTIRGLMERATIYRAISAPVALLGGMLSLGLASLLYFKPALIPASGSYVLCWVAVLVLVLAFNFLLLRKAANKRKDPFFSPGMRLAARGAFAPISVAVVLTWTMIHQGAYPMVAVIFWMIFYGLALLSTREFAPVSITRLGYSFLMGGMFCLILSPTGFNPVKAASLVMGLSFGLFHLLYALLTWPRKTHEPEI